MSEAAGGQPGGIAVSRAEVPGTLISDYLVRGVPEPKQLILLLHGFQQSGKNMMDKLAAQCPSDAVILAPNAPYPLPERRPDGSYRLGFTWYFYNPATDEYFIDMRTALQLLEGLVQKLGYAALPKRIVGFSQGGYLAPFAALRLGGVVQTVGIASEYLPDELGEALSAAGARWPLPFRTDSVHGAIDEVVPLADALSGHQKMAERGAKGEWIQIEGEGHRLTPGIQRALKGLLEIHA